MAKIDLKFLDINMDGDYIQVLLSKNQSRISVCGESFGKVFVVNLDKSTAIKFAKTLRTEINKMEVHNG